MKFRQFHHVDREDFEELLRMVEPYISKTDTVMHNSLKARERLSITLLFLATGKLAVLTGIEIFYSYQQMNFFYLTLIKFFENFFNKGWLSHIFQRQILLCGIPPRHGKGYQ